MSNFISLNKLPMLELISNGFVGSVQTEHMTIAYSELKAGVEIPLHQHIEEAIDIILDGELEMQIGDETAVITTGMVTAVPSNVPHSARALSECRVVTIFYPQRRR